MSLIPRFTAGGLMLVCLALNSGAGADDLDQDLARALREQGHILPLEQILTSLYQRYPGASLLEVDLEREDGIYVYEVELLTREGRVRELELDASSGQILSDEEDD